MKDIETPDKMHLQKLIDNLRDGEYTIPDFQRDFVWDPWDVVELLKSVFQDYYIGTLLFWRGSKENQEVLSCKPIYGYEGKSDARHIVLDGQQRLSSLFYTFFSPDIKFPNRKKKNFFFLDIKCLLEEEYEDAFYYEWDYKRVRKLLKDRDEQFKQSIFPLRVIGAGNFELTDWIKGYEKFWSEDEEMLEIAHGFYDLLRDLLNNYYVSYIELDREIDIPKVCDIFTRVNNTGEDLSIFDLLNAMLRPKGIKLKEMWRNVEDNFHMAKKKRMKTYILQTMSILKQNYCSPKYLYYLVPDSVKKVKNSKGEIEEKILIDSSTGFTKLWDFVIDKTQMTIKKITNPRDYGIIKPKYFPYTTMLPILTVLHIEQQKDKYKDKGKIQKKIKEWYWASIFTQNYSSSVESQMAKDYEELKRWFMDYKDLPTVIARFGIEINNLELKSETNTQSAIYKAIFTILIQNGAKDWETFDLPEYSNLEDHHIVPRSWGNQKGISKINSILNRVPLSAETNKEIIGDRLPNEYLRDMLDSAEDEDSIYELLNTHLLSRRAIEILLRDPFTIDDFQEFIEERESTILKEIHQLVEIEASKKNGFISPDKPYSNRVEIENTLRSCENYIYWIDKYFSGKGFSYILGVFNSSDKPSVEDIKILTSIDKVNQDMFARFKEFRKELMKLGVKAEMRVIVKSKIKHELHDRWIITDGKNYNIPSTDTIARGQYSEIKETDNKPPFEKLWNSSLDLISQWNLVKEEIK